MVHEDARLVCDFFPDGCEGWPNREAMCKRPWKVKVSWLSWQAWGPGTSARVNDIEKENLCSGRDCGNLQLAAGKEESLAVCNPWLCVSRRYPPGWHEFFPTVLPEAKSFNDLDYYVRIFLLVFICIFVSGNEYRPCRRTPKKYGVE